MEGRGLATPFEEGGRDGEGGRRRDVRLALVVEYYLWIEGDGPGCDVCCAEGVEPERHGGGGVR